MTRARDFADVISGQFDIPADSLTNAIPADGSITTAKLADDAVTEAKVADGVIKDTGRRNLILNGAMQVAQRGTVSSVTVGYGGPDRFPFSRSGAAVVTLSQDTDVPSDEGFTSSQKIDVTTADTSLAAGDYALLSHRIEGQDLQHLLYGTSEAKKLTLQFWVKSPKTGTHIVELYHGDAFYTNGQSYTIATANTWQKVTLTFDGYQTTALDNDNGIGIQVSWWLAAGSTYSGGTLSSNTWQNTAANRAAGQVNVMDSASNNFYLTGVQLEVGDSATDFEHRSYGSELSACQRYFVGGMHFMCFGRGYSPSSVGNSAPVLWPTTMRATPTITKSNEGDGGGSQTTMVFGSTRATGTNPEAESTNNTDNNYVTADITADAEL